MIVPEAMYQAGFATTYQAYALPNSNLTQLESEDRASLAEVVDSGAKNEYDFTKSYGFDNCSVDSNGVYTTQGDTLTSLRFQISAYTSSGALLANLNQTDGSFPSISSNGVYYWGFTLPSNTNYLVIGHNGSTYNGRYRQPVSDLTAGKTYVFRVEVTQATNANGAFKWKDIMTCSKVAFDVSQKFVPYKPNPFEVIRGSINFAVDVADANTAYVTQIGRIVNIQFAVKFTNAIPNSETIIGTIQGVGLPVYTTRIMISQNSELFYPAEAIAYGVINSSNGALAIRTLQATPTTMKAFFFNVTYTCQE